MAIEEYLGLLMYGPYEKIFTIAQEPANFQGGQEAWQQYLQKNLDCDKPVQKGAGPLLLKLKAEL